MGRLKVHNFIKPKLLLLTFNVLRDLCPEPLRMGKGLGQVKDLASKEHAYLSDELPISNKMEVHQLSEYAGASVLIMGMMAGKITTEEKKI